MSKETIDYMEYLDGRPTAIIDYMEYLKGLNLKELENEFKKYNLRNNEDIKNALCEYNKHFPNFLVDMCEKIYGRCELFEKYIEKDYCACSEYSIRIIKGRLPDNMHNKMLAVKISGMKNIFVERYFKHLKV